MIRTAILSGGKYGILLGPMPPEEQREHARRMFERLRPMDAGRFAVKALDQVARNRAVIVLPAWWKPLWWLERLSPTLSLLLARRLLESARRELYAAPSPAGW